MTRYCAVNSGGYFKLSPMNTWLNFPVTPGDKLLFGSNAVCTNGIGFWSNVGYGASACIVGFNNYFPSSVAICEISTQSQGNYYINCNDRIALSYAFQGSNPKMNFLGYFLLSQPSDGNTYSAMYSAGCYYNGYPVSSNQFLSQASAIAGNSCNGEFFYGGMCFIGGSYSAFSVTFFGLADLPSIFYSGNTVNQLTAVYSNGNQFIVDNCQNTQSMTFVVTDSMSTITSQTKSISTSSSSQTAFALSATISASEGGVGWSATQTLTTSYNQTQTQSAANSNTNSLELSDTISVSGSFIIPANTKMQITEQLLTTTSSISHIIQVNNSPNNVVINRVYISPAGFKNTPLAC